MIDVSPPESNRWVRPDRRLLALVVGGALLAAILECARSGSVGESAQALLGGALAGLVAAYALTLPGWGRGVSRGLVLGASFVGNAILSTTFLGNPLIVWLVIFAEGLLFIVWARPWGPTLRFSLRTGAAWLGVSYWLLGTVSALAVAQPGVAAQRLAYAGMLGLAVLAVFAGSRTADSATRDLSRGMVIAFLLALSLLLFAGASTLFDAAGRPVPTGVGADQGTRFWGGTWLLYHPNSMAGLAVAVAIRIGVDRAYGVWQRLAATVLAGLFIYLANSRTAFLFLAAAAATHAALLWWQGRRPVVGLAVYSTIRRTVAAAATPFVVLLLVLLCAGPAFLGTTRYEGGGVTSGRTDTWKQVGAEWRGDSVAEKLLGHANDARATVTRPGDGSGAADKLPTDNAAVGALRRGGVLGVLAFLVGLALLVRHALRRRAPAWFVIAVIAALPTIATTDWLLGGTGGVLWILLVAGEGVTLLGDRAPSQPADTARS